MRLALHPDTRVFIDLRATGLLRAVGHDPTLAARPEPATFEVPGDPALPVPVALVFRADRIEAPPELDRGDRARMLDNLRSADVLEAARYPTVELQGRYVGDLARGHLDGELVLRGARRRIGLGLEVSRDPGEGRVLRARGTWEGRLTDLGIKPFRALMGALRLEDWIGLRVEARLDMAD